MSPEMADELTVVKLAMELALLYQHLANATMADAVYCRL